MTRDVKDESTTPAVLRLPFTERWEKQLGVALRERGWHVHAAGSQHGKTTANRDYFLSQRAERRATGQSTCPVGLAWATDNKRMILRSLAESIGGQRFAALPHPELKVPAMLKQLGTRLIIVNNAHNLEWRQWQELLTLDDVCWGEHGMRVAIVLSGIHNQLGLANLPKQVELVEQITNRITCYREIKGHDRAEVKTALQLLLERDAPELLHQGALAHSALVFDLLTRPEIDLAGRKTVAALHLVELSRRMAAVSRSQPGLKPDGVIHAAWSHYVEFRSAPPPPTTSQAIRRALVPVAT
jgi:hypothetical protein